MRALLCLCLVSVAALILSGRTTDAQAYDASLLLQTPSKVLPMCITQFNFRGYFTSDGVQIQTPALGQTVRVVAAVTELLVYNMAESVEDAMRDYCTVATPVTKLTTDLHLTMLYTGLHTPLRLCYPRVPMTSQLASKSYYCPSVCSHRDTDEAITSRDACRLGQNSLAGKAWGLLMRGDPMDPLVLSQLRQSPILGPCLLKYFGQSAVSPNSTCLGAVGDFCYRGMCISKTARPRGFTNEPVLTGVPHTYCSVDSATQRQQKPAQFQTLASSLNASLCDACLYRSVPMTLNASWAEAVLVQQAVTSMRPACPSVHLVLTAADADWFNLVNDTAVRAAVVQRAMDMVTANELQGLVFEFGPGVSGLGLDFYTQFLIDVRVRLWTQNLNGVLLGVMTYNRVSTGFLRVATVAPFLDKFFDRSVDIKSFTTPSDCDYNMRTKCTAAHNTVRDFAENLLAQGVPPVKLVVGVSLYGSMAPGSTACNSVLGGEGVQGRIPIDYITQGGYNLNTQPVCGVIDPTTGYCTFSVQIGSDNCVWRTMREAHIRYRVSQLMTRYPSADLLVLDVSVSRNGYWIDVVKQTVTANLPSVSKAAIVGGPYYYVGSGPRVQCPGILNFVGDTIITSVEYDKTVKIPLLGGYLALDGFTCGTGAAMTPSTCAQVPTFAVDMVTLQTVSSATSRGVLYDPVNYCFVVPRSQQLCQFTATEGSKVDVYQLGTDFTDKPVERDVYWLGVSAYITIVDDWTTVIEAIPVDYKCVSFDVSSIPDCLQVVCGGDIGCRKRAASACSMDVSTRVAIMGLQQQFYAVNEVYQLMVRELTQYSVSDIDPFTGQSRAPSKFFGALLSLFGIGLGAKNAYDIAQLQDAMQTVKGMLNTQSVMLDVHDRLLKNLQAQLVSHDQQLVTVQSQFQGQQTQLNGLNQALNATNTYVNQLVQATAANAEMSNNLQTQINSQQAIIDLINSKIGVNSRAISHNSDQIMKLGNGLANISIALDNNIKAVNGRVTMLEDEVNDRFSYVASQLTKLRAQQASDVADLNYSIELHNAAMLYYQQLNNFAVTLAHNALKLTAMVESYRTCFRSLASGYLQGCPVNQPFLKSKPFFANFRSVLGIVYRQDLGVAAVLYKVPKSFRDFALYAISAKPLRVNGEWYVPRSDDVVMLGDGNFYSKPQCDSNICEPPALHPSWTDCMAAITVQSVSQIFNFCRLIKCAADHCTDVITSPVTYTGVVNLPDRSVGDFTFYNGVAPVGAVQPVPVPSVNIVPIQTSATLQDIAPAVAQVQSVVTDLSGSMTQFNAQIAKLQADVQSKLNDLYTTQLAFNLTYDQWQQLVTNLHRNEALYKQGIDQFNAGAQQFGTSLEQWKQQQGEWQGLRDEFKNVSSIYDELKKVYNAQAARFADQLNRMMNGDWTDAFTGPVKNLAIGLTSLFGLGGLGGILGALRCAFPSLCSACGGCGGCGGLCGLCGGGCGGCGLCGGCCGACSCCGPCIATACAPCIACCALPCCVSLCSCCSSCSRCGGSCKKCCSGCSHGGYEYDEYEDEEHTHDD
ncbi:membrane protein Allo46 [Cyprinid herpesvirus 3]|nr:membrane protein Allo46 [Cyprinid herpesvirus 3]